MYEVALKTSTLPPPFHIRTGRLHVPVDHAPSKDLTLRVPHTAFHMHFPWTVHPGSSTSATLEPRDR